MARKQINLDTYPRHEHFKHFLTMKNPFLTVTEQIDLTEWLPRIRRSGLPFFLSFQYAIVRAANRIPEFRQRIVDGGIVEYDYCNPSYTYGLPDGTYRYCLVNVDQPLRQYLKEARAKEAEALHTERLQEEGDVLSLLFTSCNPWFSYTAVTMPWPDTHFSIPNFVWGRCRIQKELCLVDGKVTERDKITVPLTILANHALVDGISVGRFFNYLSEELQNFESEGQSQ